MRAGTNECNCAGRLREAHYLLAEQCSCEHVTDRRARIAAFAPAFVPTVCEPRTRAASVTQQPRAAFTLSREPCRIRMLPGTKGLYAAAAAAATAEAASTAATRSRQERNVRTDAESGCACAGARTPHAACCALPQLPQSQFEAHTATTTTTTTTTT